MKKYKRGDPMTREQVEQVVDTETLVFAIYEDPENGDYDARGVAKITTANVGYFVTGIEHPEGFGNSIDFELNGAPDEVFDDDALQLFTVREQEKQATKRFSKAKVLEYIENRLREIDTEFGPFDVENGWAQVEQLGTEAKVAYGEYSGLRDLSEIFNLEGARS